MKSNVRVLVVMDSGSRCRLIEHLKALGALVLVAQTCLEAHKIILSDPSIELLLVDTTLSDGNWLTVLTNVMGRRSTSRIVVCSNSRLNNTQLPIHAEAYGAFGVLSDTYERQELDRITTAVMADAQCELEIPFGKRGEPQMPGVKEVVCSNCHVVVPLRKSCTHCGAPLTESATKEIDRKRMEEAMTDKDGHGSACVPAA